MVVDATDPNFGYFPHDLTISEALYNDFKMIQTPRKCSPGQPCVDNGMMSYFLNKIVIIKPAFQFPDG